MSRINAIENSILTLDGGKYQKLMDDYLFRKYQFKNIQPLGVQTGTDKVTKGIPDSFVKTEDDKYILIMYGSVDALPFDKLRSDILSCFDKDKLKLGNAQIEKIICAYTSTNLHIEQIQELENMIDGITVELIGIGTVAHDIHANYPYLASEYLGIPIDTEQIYDIEDFVRLYDKNEMNAPLDIKFLYRDNDIEKLKGYMDNSKITLVTGMSGVGKTKLVLEVCKTYRKLGYKILCVKNNGLMLYNDLHFYVSDEGKYILFVDDANLAMNLESIISSFVVNPHKNIEVKLVMTVRDYAKSRVREIVCKSVLPKELPIQSLKNEQIKDILIKCLGIKNDDYLSRIVRIAKGNIRLAILAGKKSITNGLLSINNATDIYKNYYGGIISDQKLSDNEICILFALSVFGPLKLRESKISLQLLAKHNITEYEFINICHELNEKELVDLYQDEVVKISDQSFANYILEYVFIEKKTITISELLQLGFPKYRNKLINSIKTLISLFNTDDVLNYIKKQVKDSWNSAPKELDISYLTSFHALNEEKSLGIIQNEIKKMPSVDFDLVSFDFNAKKNYHSINNELISILSAFKYSNNFIDAVQLLLLIFEKRPDLVMEFYFALVDRLSFDKDSISYDYSKEYEMIEFIWKFTEEGKKTNCTLLLMQVLETMLNTEYQKMEAGENARSYNILTINLCYTEGLKKFRKLIWDILAKLYEDDAYREKVDGIILGYHCSWHGDLTEIKTIMEFDLICFKNNFLDNWMELSFNQCVILKKLKEYAQRIEINVDVDFNKYNSNTEFMIYDTLIIDHMKERTIEEDEEERKNCINELIKSYDNEDFSIMFRVCNQRETKDKESWSLQTGIETVFILLENDEKRYIEALRVYLKENAPYGFFPQRKIGKLFEFIGVEKTEEFIDEFSFQYKSIWISSFLQLIPYTFINKEYISKLMKFVKEELTQEKPTIPNVPSLEKYYAYDPEIIVKISEFVIECVKQKPYVASKFLGSITDKNEMDHIWNLFDKHIDILEQIYLYTLENHTDYDGRLLIKLVTHDNNFWKKFILKYIKQANGTCYQNGIFDKLWELENYEELFNIAYRYLIIKKYYYLSNNLLSLFSNNGSTSQLIKDRKKLWILNFISKNFNEAEKMESIFEMIANIFPEQKIEYIVEFLKYNKISNDFENIPLFPSSQSWSGSEMPVIERKIDFLETLIKEIKGPEFIAHRAYLKKRLESFGEYKQKVLINEYIENADNA